MSKTLPLPCPFCGGKAHLMKGPDVCWVVCEACDITTAPFSEADEALACWNRRWAAGEATPVRQQACRDLLVIIAGLGYPAPEEGYRGNVAWAVSDLKKALAARPPSVRAALQRLMDLSSNCDYGDNGYPAPCLGIQEVGHPCHWCEALEALAQEEEPPDLHFPALLAALRPFARFAEVVGADEDDGLGVATCRGIRVSLGDCRRALAAVRAASGEEGGQ